MIAMNALLDELEARERGSVTDVVGAVDLVELIGVSHDSRHVGPDTLFACLRGAAVDGHDHAAQAIADGAVALLVDHPLAGVGDVPQIVVDDTRRRLGPIAAAVYGHPSRHLATVGITGTNGKTTTAQLLAAIFEEHGWRTGIVGTLHGARTTPEAPELQALLASFRASGCGAAVMEVSSHALALHRVDGTVFDAVVFTNLGRDHFDLHGSTEEYFRAKARLFDPSFAPLAVVNVDDTVRSVARRHARWKRRTPRRAHLDRRPRRRGRERNVALVPMGERRRDGADRRSLQRCQLPCRARHGGRARHRPASRRGRPGRRHPDPGSVRGGAGRDRRGLTVVVDYAHTPDGLAEVLAIGARRSPTPVRSSRRVRRRWRP